MRIKKLNKRSVRTANPVNRITSLSEEALAEASGGLATNCVVVTETPSNPDSKWTFTSHDGYPAGG